MKLVNRLVFVLCLFGLLISGYLLERYLTNATIACGVSLGCDLIRASPYSHPLGIPMPLFGVIFYLALAAISFAQTIKRIPPIIPFLIASAGISFSGLLFLLEIFVIHATCFWCNTSGILTVFLFILTAIAWKKK